MTAESVDRILGRFPKARVLVVGDLVLDEFVWGRAERISPEAPVPVVWAETQSYMPGGASNVANNIVSLGAACTIFGVIGDDGDGEDLKREVESRGIDPSGMAALPGRPTTIKTRVIAHNQQVVRTDSESSGSASRTSGVNSCNISGA